MSRAGSWSGLPVLLIVSLCIAGCAMRGADGGFDRGTVCRDGAGSNNRQAPIVCVDDSARTLSVSPEPIRVHDVMQNDRKTAVPVHWFTRSGGGDLRIEMEPGCVNDIKCDGRGHCWTRTAQGSAGKQCKYDVWINGGAHDRLDPTLVVDACCS